VTVFDVGTWEGQLFIALEFVDGGSAREWIAREPRGPREVVRLWAQAGRGLAAAHEAGVVHRDLKPDNVLVRADGRAQVTDFGLAADMRSAVRSSDAAGAADVAALREVWRTLGDALAAALGPRVTPFLAPPHPVHAAHATHSPEVAR